MQNSKPLRLTLVKKGFTYQPIRFGSFEFLSRWLLKKDGLREHG